MAEHHKILAAILAACTVHFIMNSVLYEKATCVCHYTEANVSLHALRCNLNSFTDKQPACRYFTVCFRSGRRQNILLEPANLLSFWKLCHTKKKKKSDAFQNLCYSSCLQISFFTLEPRHEISFYGQIAVFFFKCRIVSCRARTCVWLLHNHIF